jgi:hypothetical protein
MTPTGSVPRVHLGAGNPQGPIVAGPFGSRFGWNPCTCRFDVLLRPEHRREPVPIVVEPDDEPPSRERRRCCHDPAARHPIPSGRTRCRVCTREASARYRARRQVA